MGWLRLVGSLRLQGSFAKEPYKRHDNLQKGPIILKSLLIVATPQHLQVSLQNLQIFLQNAQVSLYILFARLLERYLFTDTGIFLWTLVSFCRARRPLRTSHLHNICKGVFSQTQASFYRHRSIFVQCVGLFVHLICTTCVKGCFHRHRHLLMDVGLFLQNAQVFLYISFARLLQRSLLKDTGIFYTQVSFEMWWDASQPCEHAGLCKEYIGLFSQTQAFVCMNIGLFRNAECITIMRICFFA